MALGATLLAACAGPPAGSAAVVNGDAIELSQLEAQVRAQVDAPDSPFAGLPGDQRTGQIAELQRQILTRLVRVELLSQVAEERGITVSEQEIEDRWQQEIAFQGDEQALLDLLVTLGLTEEQARQQLAVQVAQEKLQEAVAAEVEVDEQQVRAMFEERAAQGQYERADVSHILVETEEEAQAILELLAQGEGFEDLARERSTDPGSAEQGGNLGQQPRGTFVEEFEAAVWEATPGEIIGPVQTQFGFHIIRVNEFIRSSFEDVRESLADELRQQQVEASFGELISGLFASAEVTVDARFGAWDPATGEIVDADPLAS